ncbi:MAG TPA: glycosyltransferase family 39 protein [Candidatus Hydrogenedentes bacterium]|jgi:4-amino-4-deoxy-L-arabinose transferase-like glycosyltransferase|nr:glycosyltransferase family 39 protein [Candidatus Hydrogenedentota bacterium]
MNKEWMRIGAALALAAVLFSINLGGYDLWPPDEPRYALVAREMMDSGDYLHPRVNNQPYTEKPPLLFWCIAACSSLTGEVTPVSARIPSVLSGLVVLLFTALLARELFNARIAFWSVLILMTMQRFWWNSRFGQIDMLLAACLAAGLYGYWRYEKSGRWGWLVWFYTAALAGLYAKGPGVLVFPTLFVLAWTWRAPNRTRAWAHLVIGCSLCVVVYALWAVPVHIAFAREVQEAAGDALASNMFRQTLGRFFLGVSHANWPWYYLTTLPVDWLPWTLFLPWVALWVWRHRHDGPSMRFLLSWTVPAFLFFCIAIGKRNVYLLPLFPAFAIFFAAGVLDFMDNGNVTWRKRLGWIYALLLFGIGQVPVMISFTEYKALVTPTMYVFAVAIFVCGLVVMPIRNKTGNSFLHLQVFGSFFLLALFCATLIFPAMNIHKSARYFCRPVAELAEKGVDFDLYSVGFAREEYVFYSRRFLKELYTESIHLEHAHDMDASEIVKLQKDLSRAIAKAVEKVDIENIAAIRPDELETLQRAVNEVVGKEDYPPEIIQDFKKGLEQESEGFFAVFGSSKPAFLYVQEYDWRWIYAVHPDIHGAVVLDQSNVGSRRVLLIANPAGAKLLPSPA